MLICFPCQIPWLFYGKEQDQIKINIINLWVYITKTKIYKKFQPELNYSVGYGSTKEKF